MTTSAGSLNLSKGSKVDLTKTHPGLTAVKCGLGWDANSGTSGNFDLDAFAFGLRNGKITTPPLESVLYFGSPRNAAGKLSVMNEGLVHSGDNLTGVGAGDDEVIQVDFSKLPADVDEVYICVNIYDAVNRRQNFGMVNNAYIRVMDASAGTEFCRYDLSEDYSSFTGILAGKVYKHGTEWKFQAVGQGVNGDINAIINPYQN